MREKTVKKYIDALENKPSIERAEHYADMRKNALFMTPYAYQEKCLSEFFAKYPKNDSMSCAEKREIVRVKCLLVDRYYSTNLKEGFDDMVDNILREEVGFDERIERGELDLVDRIKRVQSKLRGKKQSLSFASKYCSRHRPTVYPIYDSYVRVMLCCLNKKYGFYGEAIREKDLRNNYAKYKEVLDSFINCRSFFGERQLTYKEADDYLWTWAKEILYIESNGNFEL